MIGYYLQDTHDDACYKDEQEELSAANRVGFGEAGNKEGERSDEVNGCHGDHCSFGRVRWNIWTIVVSVVAVTAIAAVPRAIAAAHVSAAIAHTRTMVTHAIAILDVPHESWSHASKYRHAQHEHRSHHRLGDPRRGQPFVEVLRSVLNVVRSRRRWVCIVITLRAIETAWGAKSVVGWRGERRTVDWWALVMLPVKHRSKVPGTGRRNITSEGTKRVFLSRTDTTW